MTVVIRKWVALVEEVMVEGGYALERPHRRAAVAAIFTNPYAGQHFEDLSELIELGEFLGEELTRRCQEALGTEVEAYGKAGVVGERGEVEHVAAVLHPKFGAPVRARVQGVSILPSTLKRGGPGTMLDIPIHHRRAMLVRSHFDSVEIRVADAPAGDELLIALAVANGGRPHARVGGLRAEDVIGVDGLR